MGGRVGQRIDDLQLLEERAGPPVGDDDRQGILVLRTNMDEVNVQTVDLGHEVREGPHLRLALAPVVLGRPVMGEPLRRRELRALGDVAHRFTFGPSRRLDASPQVLQLGIGDDGNVELTDSSAVVAHLGHVWDLSPRRDDRVGLLQRPRAVRLSIQ